MRHQYQTTGSADLSASLWICQGTQLLVYGWVHSRQGVITRQSQYSDGWRKIHTLRASSTCQHPSLLTTSIWEVLIWTTIWGLTIPLVVQEQSGGDTVFGSSSMFQSSVHWFWNVFLLTEHALTARTMHTKHPLDAHLIGCSRCVVNLCRSGSFLQYHTENSYIWQY